ncbi:hypothetical protein NC652_029448 [Populus alba x Populus x berolinensis]|nr:hypothetical protein NC652_029448 [Populus alba x Populus x berolinensis]
MRRLAAFKSMTWFAKPKNPSIRVHSVASEQSVEANEESGSCSGQHLFRLQALWSKCGITDFFYGSTAITVV